MANRTYQGQLYQAATTEFRLSTPEGFDFRLQTWQDLKIEYGSDKKMANNADGSPGGYTADVVKATGGIKLRLEEWYALQTAWLQFDPTVAILQQLFGFSVTYGNVLSQIRKDTGTLLFNKTTRDLPKSQDPLMVDLPFLPMSFLENGAAPILFPV